MGFSRPCLSLQIKSEFIFDRNMSKGDSVNKIGMVSAMAANCFGVLKNHFNNFIKLLYLNGNFFKCVLFGTLFLFFVII